MEAFFFRFFFLWLGRPGLVGMDEWMDAFTYPVPIWLREVRRGEEREGEGRKGGVE